jgi:hypothetical protein
MAAQVEVLGRVGLTDPEADRALGTGQARELLALLVARRATATSTGDVVDALWPDGAPPATAVTIVHGLVRRIRGALGREAVATDEAGYRLALPPGAVDLWVVDDLLAEGRADEARRRWADPAFGPYASRSWARAGSQRSAAVLRPTPTETGLLRLRQREPVSRLVGRRRELAATVAACRRARLVVLVGLGGVGKTRLALEVVRQLDHTTVVHVDVGAAIGPVADRLAAEVGQATSGDPATDLRAAASLIGRRRQLLVLDGCEHDAAGCAEAIEVLLGACPELSIIATSRSSLGIPGEQVVPLLPFADPDDVRGDAVELLLDRAQGTGLALTAEDRVRAAEICRRSAGVPLAIELAVAELVFAAGALPATHVAGPSPEEAVAASVAQATAQLSPSTAVIARRAAVLVAGFTPELVRTMDGQNPAATGSLHELVASGLVVGETAGGVRRLRFLDRVREHLVAASDASDLTVVQATLVEHFRAVRPDLTAPPSVPHLVRAATELANLQAVLAGLDEAGLTRERLVLATAAGATWSEDGHWARGARDLGAALLGAQSATPLERAAGVWAQAAVVATYAGVRDLLPALAEAAAVARTEGALPLEAHLRLHLSNARGYAGDRPGAMQEALRLRALARQIGSEYVDIGAASIDGAGRLLVGDAEGAHAILRDLARRVEGLGGLSDAARLQRLAALGSRMAGDPGRAREELEVAEALAVAAHSRGSLATIRGDLADLRFQLEGSAAADVLESALDAALAVGNLRSAGIVRTRLGTVHGEVATVARGALDLWFADGRWAAAALAQVVAALPATHALHAVAPPVIAALAEGWGAPLDPRERELVAPFLGDDAPGAVSDAAADEVVLLLQQLVTDPAPA